MSSQVCQTREQRVDLKACAELGITGLRPIRVGLPGEEKRRHARQLNLRPERFGQSSERRALLDQLELQLFELKEDQARAEPAIANPEVGASAATQMPLIEAIGAQETCGDPCREARGTHHGTIFRIYGYSTGRHFPQEATRPTLIGSDSCRDRRFLANAPQRIRSIGHRKWVCVGLQEGWYEIDSLLASHGIDSPGKVIEIHDSGLPQRKKPSCE